jgi:hypothetical protein
MDADMPVDGSTPTPVQRRQSARPGRRGGRVDADPAGSRRRCPTTCRPAEPDG